MSSPLRAGCWTGTGRRVFASYSILRSSVARVSVPVAINQCPFYQVYVFTLEQGTNLTLEYNGGMSLNPIREVRRSRVCRVAKKKAGGRGTRTRCDAGSAGHRETPTGSRMRSHGRPRQLDTVATGDDRHAIVIGSRRRVASTDTQSS